MFESAELGHKIDKERWSAEVPQLRADLLEAQYELVKKKGFSTVVVIGGIDGAGKSETINVLSEWMDTRHMQTTAFSPVDHEISGRPPMWRFWRSLPPQGKIAVFAGSWYTSPITLRAYGEIKSNQLDHALVEIRAFERMLTDEGVLLLKFWFHLSKDRQKKRLKELSHDDRNAWRIGENEWRHFELYDKFVETSVRAIRETSTGNAPWTIVEGSDHRYRCLTVGRTMLDAMQKRLAKPEAAKAPTGVRTPPITPSIDGKHLVTSLDLESKMDKDKYPKEVDEQQGKLNLLTRHPKFKKLSVVVVFEGSDAAGKGGAIRRVTQALDARQYNVISIAAPTDEEKARPYLWRFWRNLPEDGRIGIFDRSWYGRVLVERVEGFCSEADWMRAYGEINDFEEQLVKNDTVVVKLWLQISKEEQLRRFEERQATAHKQHKITDEDWRNREKWDAYTQAVSDMIDRTSTELAPWTLVPANDKYKARIQVLKTIHGAIRDFMS